MSRMTWQQHDDRNAARFSGKLTASHIAQALALQRDADGWSRLAEGAFRHDAALAADARERAARFSRMADDETRRAGDNARRAFGYAVRSEGGR